MRQTLHLDPDVEKKSCETLLPLMETEDAKFLSQTEQCWQEKYWMYRSGPDRREAGCSDVMVNLDSKNTHIRTGDRALALSLCIIRPALSIISRIVFAERCSCASSSSESGISSTASALLSVRTIVGTPRQIPSTP